jgi:hypothetical protein
MFVPLTFITRCGRCARARANAIGSLVVDFAIPKAENIDFSRFSFCGFFGILILQRQAK